LPPRAWEAPAADAARVVEQWRRDALEPGRELLTVERVADRADLQKLPAKLSRLDQGRRRIGAQAATQEALEPVLGLPGHQRLPQRRTVEWCPTADTGVHLKWMVAFHLVDVHDLPLVQDAEMDGLLGRQHEAPRPAR